MRLNDSGFMDPVSWLETALSYCENHNIKLTKIVILLIILVYFAGGSPVDYVKELRTIASQNGGIIDNRTAAAHGVSRAMLAKLCAETKIRRILRGQYVFTDDRPDELLSIDKRSPYILFSHETALFLHGISDRIPPDPTITVPSGKVPSGAILSACRVYYIKPALFELGKTTLVTPAGNNVSGYDLERTICDIVRSRSKVGTEIFSAALKGYAVSQKKNLNRLDDYARQFSVANLLHQYLSVLL